MSGLGKMSTKRKPLAPVDDHNKSLENDKHEMFAKAFVRGVSLTDAAIEAGFAPGSAGVTGSRLLKRPDIQARVATLREMHGLLKGRPAHVDRQWVLNSLVRNVENALSANDRGAANRGLELLGREYGLFTERRMEIASPLDGLTADQLLSLLAAAEQLGGAPMIDVTPGSDVSSLRSGVSDANEINGLEDDGGYIVPDEADPASNGLDLDHSEELDQGNTELDLRNSPPPASIGGGGEAGAGGDLGTPPAGGLSTETEAPKNSGDAGAD